MNLVRLAQLKLSEISSEDWEWRAETDGVVLHTQRLSEPQAPVSLLVVAEVPLASLPPRSEAGQLVIEEEALRRCERAIEEFANLAAVATQSSRALSSPIPEVAFSAVTDEERSWLDQSAGIHRPGYSRGALRWQIELGGRNIEFLSDRSDGVALLAEALSDDHPTGRFRELLRVFERGFKLSPYRLIDPVTEFLSHFDALRFDKEEVKHWLKDLRDTATHADRREDYVLARDLSLVLPRVELAAYDVLFNKANWRCADSERRDAWTPEGGALRDGSVVLRSDARAPYVVQFLDGFGAFPLALETRLGDAPPEGWWLEQGSRERIGRVGHVDVVQSLHNPT